MGWGGVIDKVLEHFTPKERARRIKDEINKLTKERDVLLISKMEEKQSRRLAYIVNRLKYLAKQLQNYA